MKVSFVTTVLNEEENILALLRSLNSQTIIPGEVVIADGGSWDETVRRVENFINSRENKLNIKIIKTSGNRSKGRNKAVAESDNEVIVSTDAGCVPDHDWIEKIVKPFKDGNADAVAGFYRSGAKNIFQKALASYTCVMPDRLDPLNFLPSSRSIAFKKTAWERVKGYPEFLDTCEDLYFARELKRKGFKFVTEKEAIVTWSQRKNFSQAFIQFFKYAKGDGEARFFRRSTPFLYGRYFAGIIMLYIFITTGNKYVLFGMMFSLFLYVIWSILKNYRYVRNEKAFLYLPILQFISDIAVLSGTSYGLLKSFIIRGN